MDLKEYDEFVKSTAIFPQESAALYPFLGLAGECGETIEKFLTAVRHGHISIEANAEVLFRVLDILDMVRAACGEAEKLKKDIRDNGLRISAKIRDTIFVDDVIFELSDILWYISTINQALGSTSESCMIKNVEKLKSRQKRNKICGDGDNR